MYRPTRHIISGEGLKQKLRVLVPFFSDQKNWRVTRLIPNPPFTSLFCKIARSKFRDVHFVHHKLKAKQLCIQIYNDLPPSIACRERSLSYKVCPLFTYGICYWEVCIHFSDRRDFLLVGFPMGIVFHGAESLQGLNCSGKFYTREICKNFYAKIF